MGFEIEKKDGQALFKIDRELTISDVSALKENIIKEMPLTDTLVIDLKQVDTIDIAGLQLLCAANRSYEKQKKFFVIEAGENTGFFKTFMVQAGYDESGSCHEGTCKRCLWKGDKVNHGKKNTDS